MPSVVQHLTKEYNGTDTLAIATPTAGNLLVAFIGHRSASQGTPGLSFVGETTSPELRGWVESQPTSGTYRRGIAAFTKVADGTETTLTVEDWDGVSNAVEFMEFSGVGIFDDIFFGHTTVNTLDEETVDVDCGVLVENQIRIGAAFVKKNAAFPGPLTSFEFDNLQSDKAYEDDATSHGMHSMVGWTEDAVAGAKTDQAEFAPDNGSRAMDAVVLTFLAEADDGPVGTNQSHSSGKGAIRRNVGFGEWIQKSKAVEANYNYDEISATFDSPPAVGNLIVATHHTGDANSDAPTGFTQGQVVTDATNADEIALYWRIADGTESLERTITAGSTAADEHALSIIEFQGPFEASPVDVIAKEDSNGGTTHSSGTTATTSQADILAVAFYGSRADSGVGLYTARTNGFTELVDEAMLAKQLGVTYKVLDAIGTVESTVTMSQSALTMGGVVTFKKALAVAVSLTENDSDQTQTSDDGTLTQHGTVAPGDTAATQASDTAALTQHNTLALVDSSQGHGSDTTALTQHNQAQATDTGHTQASDTPALTQAGAVAPGDTSQAQASDSPGLTQASDLSPLDTSHAQSADSPSLVEQAAISTPGSSQQHQSGQSSLTAAYNASPARSTQAQTSDAPALTQAHTLAPGDSAHAHASDDGLVSQGSIAQVSDTSHAQAADSPALTQHGTLAPQGSTHSHAADTVAIVSRGTLAPGHTLQAQQVDSPGLSEKASVALDSTSQAHTSGNVVLLVSGVLAGTDSAQAQDTDAPGLTQHGQLSAGDSTQAQDSADVGIGQAVVVALTGSTHTQASDSPTLTQAHQLGAADSGSTQQSDAVTIIEIGALASGGTSQVQNVDLSSLTEHANVVLLDTSHSQDSREATAIDPSKGGLGPVEDVDGQATARDVRLGDVCDIQVSGGTI